MPDASTRIPCSSQNMPPTWRNLHERHEHMIQKRSNKINEVSKVNLLDYYQTFTVLWYLFNGANDKALHYGAQRSRHWITIDI